MFKKNVVRVCSPLLSETIARQNAALIIFKYRNKSLLPLDALLYDHRIYTAKLKTTQYSSSSVSIYPSQSQMHRFKIIKIRRAENVVELLEYYINPQTPD